MSILTTAQLAESLFLQPIMISMNSLVQTLLLSFLMSANGQLDWRPISICVASDILVIGADHLKDQEDEFTSHHDNVNDRHLVSLFVYAKVFFAVSAVVLGLTLLLCPIRTLLATAVFVVPALLWTTPINLKDLRLNLKRLIGIDVFGEDKHQARKSTLVIKRIPGMKAIFNGIIRGCGLYVVVRTVLFGSGSLNHALPSPWTSAQLIAWSTVDRVCHAVMTDVRDFENDLKTGVPTIPILIGSVVKTKLVLTACHMLVMLVFIENPYIMSSCLWATALVWMLGIHSSKRAFWWSTHSRSPFIIWYFLMRYTA
ncbi:uncharacterized protein EDB91DRAFT_1059590 [Suillus paluster]|uniref:uncharacterized protein n=1 Tax=Suillus paluster TaxID=48578 RepID=UPI001B8815F1|nr:uncharacterized protein EDB91DRAFT_1059590 [Suillus paluster]KAG1730253.1 hypothetical protein EDB91DRAFT_1059590 [Suillus paluster]